MITPHLRSSITAELCLSAVGPVVHGSTLLQSIGQSLDDGWRFHLGDAPGAEDAGVSTAGWEEVTLPHPALISEYGYWEYYALNAGFSQEGSWRPADQSMTFLFSSTAKMVATLSVRLMPDSVTSLSLFCVMATGLLSPTT